MKLLLCASLFLLTAPLQDWIVEPIDNRVSVSFPSKPTKKMLGEDPYFTAVSENGFSCTVMVTDYSKNAPDTTSLAAYMASPAAMQSTEESLVRDFKGGKILNSKTTTYSGHVSIDITMATGRNSADGEFDMMDYRIIVVGIKVYSLYFYYQQSKPLPSLRDKFYTSFKIK